MEAMIPPSTTTYLGGKIAGRRATGVERHAKRVYAIAGIQADWEGSIPWRFSSSRTTPRDFRLPLIRQLITTLAAKTSHSWPIVDFNRYGSSCMANSTPSQSFDSFRFSFCLKNRTVVFVAELCNF